MYLFLLLHPASQAKCIQGYFCICFCFAFLVVVLRLDLTLQSWMTWNSVCKPDRPQRDLPDSASQGLGLKMWATVPSSSYLLIARTQFLACSFFRSQMHYGCIFVRLRWQKNQFPKNPKSQSGIRRIKYYQCWLWNNGSKFL